jgi:hypothetical protein
MQPSPRLFTTRLEMNPAISPKKIQPKIDMTARLKRIQKT